MVTSLETYEDGRADVPGEIGKGKTEKGRSGEGEIESPRLPVSPSYLTSLVGRAPLHPETLRCERSRSSDLDFL